MGFSPRICRPTNEQRRVATPVQLGDESVSLPMTKAQFPEGAHFDRFGFFTSPIGGQMVRIFFDNLPYTAEPK